MRHFEKGEIAKRYTVNRPQVQADILRQVASSINWHALERGESLETIDAWLEGELESTF